MAPTDPLRAAGLRRTPARVAVHAAIIRLARPLSHSELLNEPSLQGMDAITLYRTLRALEEAGLAHRVLGTDGTWRTCSQPGMPAGCPGNHVHFMCQDCGQMTCLIEQPMPRVEPPTGAVVAARHFLAYGRCAACLGATLDGPSSMQTFGANSTQSG
jgi:Fur family transcriptional regulator, ferric uptake regulator